MTRGFPSFDTLKNVGHLVPLEAPAQIGILLERLLSDYA